MGNTCISPEGGNENKNNENTVDVLFVGGHDSGKSTLIKHVQLVYGQLRLQHTKKLHKQLVKESITEHIKTFINVTNDYNTQHPDVFENDSLDELNDLDIVQSEQDVKVDDNNPPPFEIKKSPDNLSKNDAEKIHQMWEDGKLHTILKYIDVFSRDQFSYIIEAATRSASQEFIPTDMDILRCHWQTTGICQIEMPGINEQRVRIHDCGGHLHERRKWSLLFTQTFETVFIVVSLDSFCHTLYENPSVNRMVDALDLVRSISKSKNFRNFKKVLVLNKLDLFTEDMIAAHFDKFKQVFPEYDGGAQVEPALEYIETEFLNILKHGDGLAHPSEVLQMSALDILPGKSSLRRIFDHWVPAPKPQEHNGERYSTDNSVTVSGVSGVSTGSAKNSVQDSAKGSKDSARSSVKDEQNSEDRKKDFAKVSFDQGEIDVELSSDVDKDLSEGSSVVNQDTSEISKANDSSEHELKENGVVT